MSPDEDTLKRMVIGASSPITKAAALTLLTGKNSELKKEIEDLKAEVEDRKIKNSKGNNDYYSQ